MMHRISYHMKYFTILLVLIGFVASLFMGFSDSDAFNGGGIVVEVPGQIMDISNNVISPGQTMVVNGTFNQPVDKFTASVFKNYEDSRKLVLTLSPSSDESGDFDFSFTIPDDWELGTYTILLENGLQFMDWKFTVRQNHGEGTLDRTVYPVPWSMSPLKQFKSEIPFHEIQCKDNLRLTQRYDGTPACVKQETYFELIKRDWTSEIIKAVQSRDISQSGQIPIPKPEPVVNEDGTISENTSPYTWHDIAGLKQIYHLGEPISFTETVQGYDNPCVRQHYEILDSNTLEPVWKYKGMVYPCPFIKNPEYFKITRTIPDENTPLLNQTGPYIFRSYHTYSDGYTVKTFSVVDDSFVTNTVDPCNVSYDLDANDLRKRTAPPISIGEYGRDATLMEPFVFNTSIGKLSIPSYMPSCYELKSDKIKNDLRTLVFYPDDMAYSDDVTITKIIKEGIFILISDASETPEEWSDSVEKSIKESPKTMSYTTLKDSTVLLISGIPSKDMSSTVKMIVDDKRIEIISTKLDTAYLMDVLESMFEN